ncbi:uncharacterized protein LOC126195289 [Schistocerca nitens]|uniref:uncharacterized protein LOC126195289 n=1 Tax=Schistocerca nitens TaxID=7011 RepID=UPI002118ED47|nr:uncharacterized protein LOC126195289 [Schistocerca nitens]
MRSLLLAFSLLLATASQSTASPPQRAALGFLAQLRYLTQLAASTCSQAGQTICNAACTQVILCVSDGQGGFQEVPQETCSSDTRCSAEQGTCVEGATSCGSSPGGSIYCTEFGYFPDPYDCTVYHICLAANVQSTPHQCADGYAYNPLTSECSFRTTDPVCTSGPVPACITAGQTGALDTDPSMYYVCTADANGVLTPLLYKCHNGKVYDPATYSCVDPTSSPGQETTATTTSATSTVSTTTPSTPIPGTFCSPPLARLPDPDDCTRYYECSEHWTWVHGACTWGTYYNPVHQECELGFC